MRSPILVALVHPLNILMLGASAVAGLVAAWWLFPVGLLFWLAMVVAVSRDPALKINIGRERRTDLARRFQPYFDRIERAHVNVFNNLTSAPAGTRRALQPVLDEMEALVNRTYSLCLQMTSLDNYRVVAGSQTDLRTDLQRINEMLAHAEDPSVRQEYEQSRQALEERMARLRAVSAQLDRVEAQLLSLTSEMDSIVTEVLRLRAARDASGGVLPLVEKLRQQAAELEAFASAP